MSIFQDEQTGQPNWPLIGGVIAGGVLLFMAVKGKGTGSVANAGTSLNAATGQLEYQGLRTQGMLTDVQNQQRALTDAQAQNRQLLEQLGASLGTYTGAILDAFGPLYGTTGVQPTAQGYPGPGGVHGGGVMNPGSLDHAPPGGGAQGPFSQGPPHGQYYDTSGQLVTFSGPETSAGELYRRALGSMPSAIGQLAVQGPYPPITAVPSAN